MLLTYSLDIEIRNLTQMIEAMFEIVAKNPPSILIAIGGLLAILGNPTWPIFLGLGVILQLVWLAFVFR